MFQFLFKLFTLFFLSLLFKVLLQSIQIIFPEKSTNKLFENKLLAMDKLAKAERKTTGSFVIENNENIFMMKPCFYGGRLPLNRKELNK